MKLRDLKHSKIQELKDLKIRGVVMLYLFTADAFVKVNFKHTAKYYSNVVFKGISEHGEIINIYDGPLWSKMDALYYYTDVLLLNGFTGDDADLIQEKEQKFSKMLADPKYRGKMKKLLQI